MQRLFEGCQKGWLQVFAVIVITCCATGLNAKTYIGVMQGLAGEDFYQRQFDEQIEVIETSSNRLGANAELTLLTGEKATRQDALDWFNEMAGSVSSSDRVLFYFIGHGSYDDSDYKFNLRGPDLTGAELKQAFAELEVELKLLVNTSSSSGALLELFEEEPDTVLITATKSGRERIATRFGRFFVKALEEESADLDKNGMISAKESYDYAERETADFYTSEGLIATEHSVLQGEHANLVSLGSLVDLPTVESGSELAVLYQERDDMDFEIERLRIRRIGMSAEDYRRDFQALVIQLSVLQAKIEELEGVEP